MTVAAAPRSFPARFRRRLALFCAAALALSTAIFGIGSFLFIRNDKLDRFGTSVLREVRLQAGMVDYDADESTGEAVRHMAQEGRAVVVLCGDPLLNGEDLTSQSDHKPAMGCHRSTRWVRRTSTQQRSVGTRPNRRGERMGEASRAGSPCTGAYRARHRVEMSFSSASTALLVIDPVNDFLSEGGAGWEMTKGTVKKNDVVEKLKTVIAGARQHGIPVLFGPMAYTAEDYADEQLQRRSGINRIMFENKMFLAGSWGADFHPDLRPADHDVVLLPHKGVDVFETDLPDHLSRLGTTHLVIAGMTANLCCESTGRHAMEHGYDVTFLSDAIGATNLPAYEASIRINYPLIGNAVLTVEEFLAAVDGQSGDVRPGDTVVGSDGGDIGDVEQVVAPSGDDPGYMLVPRGLVFEKDTFIPLDTIVRRTGGRVHINVPKLVVSKMPWGEPPAAGDIAAKIGPAVEKVEALYGSRSPSG